MDGGATVSGGLGWVLYSISELAFKWIPGTVAAVTGTAPAATPVLPTTPITAPVSTEDVARYLQNVSDVTTYNDFYHSWSTFVALSTLFSLFFAALIIYCFIRIRQIRHYERLQLKAAAHPIVSHDLSKTQLRWNRILEEISSDSQQSWRLAILECDIMLNELLDMQGYKGETMGDKMKQVERADFHSIDLAWEAHRVRNKVAHEGTQHILNAREARRVVELYHTIFKEFRLLH